MYASEGHDDRVLRRFEVSVSEEARLVEGRENLILSVEAWSIRSTYEDVERRKKGEVSLNALAVLESSKRDIDNLMVL
jgi:hypothetical protein